MRSMLQIWLKSLHTRSVQEGMLEYRDVLHSWHKLRSDLYLSDGLEGEQELAGALLETDLASGATLPSGSLVKLLDLARGIGYRRALLANARSLELWPRPEEAWRQPVGAGWKEALLAGAWRMERLGNPSFSLKQVQQLGEVVQAMAFLGYTRLARSILRDVPELLQLKPRGKEGLLHAAVRWEDEALVEMLAGTGHFQQKNAESYCGSAKMLPLLAKHGYVFEAGGRLLQTLDEIHAGPAASKIALAAINRQQSAKGKFRAALGSQNVDLLERALAQHAGYTTHRGAWRISLPTRMMMESGWLVLEKRKDWHVKMLELAAHTPEQAMLIPGIAEKPFQALMGQCMYQAMINQGDWGVSQAQVRQWQQLIGELGSPPSSGELLQMAKVAQAAGPSEARTVWGQWAIRYFQANPSVALARRQGKMEGGDFALLAQLGRAMWDAKAARFGDRLFDDDPFADRKAPLPLTENPHEDDAVWILAMKRLFSSERFATPDPRELRMLECVTLPKDLANLTLLYQLLSAPEWDALDEKWRRIIDPLRDKTRSHLQQQTLEKTIGGGRLNDKRRM